MEVQGKRWKGHLNRDFYKYIFRRILEQIQINFIINTITSKLYKFQY